MDKISEQKISTLHPKVRDEVTQILLDIEKVLTGKSSVRITEALRTIEYQNGLYALGRTKVNPDGKSSSKPLGNIVTKAMGGQSYHNYGLAVDFCLIVGGKATWETNKDFDLDNTPDWAEVVKVFKKYGWKWGGEFTTILDEPHFEKTFNNNFKVLLANYNAGKTFNDNGEKYVIIDPIVNMELTSPLTKNYYVKTLQKALNSKGYKIDIDGFYGNATVSVVKDYQKRLSLPITGITDNILLKKLSII